MTFIQNEPKILSFHKISVILINESGVLHIKSKIFQIKKIDISEHSEYTSSVMVQKDVLSENVNIHWHNYYEIEYITDGKGTEITNGEPSEITPGMMHILSPSDFHELVVDAPLSLIKICFDLSDITPEVFRIITRFQKQRFLFDGSEKELFDKLFCSALMQKTLYGNTELYPLVAKKILETILLNALGCTHEHSWSENATEKRSDINAILAYIQTNYTKRLTLAEVAEKTHFSPSYLSRYFHKTVGMTFVQYVKHLRIEMAAKLLANTDSDITAICYEIGYSSPASFSNEFKKAYKVSPTEYRKISNRKNVFR